MDDLFSNFKRFGRLPNRAGMLTESENVLSVSAIFGLSSSLGEFLNSEGIDLSVS